MKLFGCKHFDGMLTWFHWGLGVAVGWDEGPEFEMTVGPLWFNLHWHGRG